MLRSLVREWSSNAYFLKRSKLNGQVLDVARNNPEPVTHFAVYPVKGIHNDPDRQWTTTENGLIKSRLNGLGLNILEKI